MKTNNIHQLAKQQKVKRVPTFHKMTKEEFCARILMEQELNREKDA